MDNDLPITVINLTPMYYSCGICGDENVAESGIQGVMVNADNGDIVEEGGDGGVHVCPRCWPRIESKEITNIWFFPREKRTVDVQQVIDSACATDSWEPIRKAMGMLKITDEEMTAYAESGPDGLPTAGWSDKRLRRFSEMSFLQLVPFVMKRRELAQQSKR